MVRTLFQPIVNISERKIIGYEATMRGLNGETPLDMFSASRSINKIIELDNACVNLAIQRKNILFPADTLLFVNLHPFSVISDSFAIQQKDLSNVVFEITENCSMLEKSKSLLCSLQSRGASIAIDDFGKSYSNYDRFLFDWMRIQYVKLDRDFTRRCWDSKMIALIEGLIQVFNKMSINFVVEGVETPDEHEILRRAGVNLLQGYYLGRPQYFEDILDKVTKSPEEKAI